MTADQHDRSSSLDYSAIFLSDIHLGSKDCQAEAILALLAERSCKTLFLIGDIVDLEALKQRIFWPPSHQKLLTRLLALPSEGVRVVYIPGNHDDAVRALVNRETDSRIGAIELHQAYDYKAVSGRRLLLIHGDAFDSAVCGAPLLGWIGDTLYTFLLWLNRCYNFGRRLRGLPYWSLAGFIKSQIGTAQTFITRFRNIARQYASDQGYDGVICGHIHQADFVDDEAGLYGNCGDWIESCTFLGERPCGRFELVHWAGPCKRLESDRAAVVDNSLEGQRRIA